MNNLHNNTGSFLKYLKGHIAESGARRTFKSMREYLKISSLLSDYLIIKGIQNGRSAFRGPLSVQIDLTADCNNNCICCWCNSPLKKEKITAESEKKSLDYQTIIGVIDELHAMGVKEITLSGGGEPFMYPRLFDVIERIKRKKIYCQLFTNFTLATKYSIINLIDLNLDRLVVSLWAAGPKTYKSLHPNKEEADFYRVRENLVFLSGLKNRKKDKKPLLRIHNVINTLNYGEIKEIAGFTSEVGANELSFSVMDAIPKTTDRLLLDPKQKKSVLRDLGELNHGVTVYGLNEFVRRLSSQKAGNGVYDEDIVEAMPCYLGWLFARINSDGNVNPCLKSHRLPVGNIYKQRFQEIWDSSLQQEFREKAKSLSKKDPYFFKIGNGESEDSGCFRVCDDLTRNIAMHRKLTIFPTAGLVLKIAHLDNKVSNFSRKKIRLIKIIYLFSITLCYSVFLKTIRVVKEITIFPGE